MRITVNSPDGLGDFILRLPLVEALLAKGGQLQLVMRPPAANLAKELFPETEVLVLEKCPFHAETKRLRHPFRGEIAQIRRFAPDLYVAATFQLSFFDEVFLEENRDISAAGFVAADDLWPSDTSFDPREMAARYAVCVQVPVAMPEGEKNRRMASALTEGEFTPATTRMPSARVLEAARHILKVNEVKERDFIIVCAGSRPGLLMKDWGEKNWAPLLAEISRDESRAFVFVGNPKEEASIAKLRGAMAAGSHHVSLAASPPDIAVSHALLSLASVYVGRDSGIMHLAALAGTRLLAVFSGGHWPRFVPESKRGIILTRKAPCRGCNFYCPYPEHWCATSVPVESVREAWSDLPTVQSLEIRELPEEGAPFSRIPASERDEFVRRGFDTARDSVKRLHRGNQLARLLKWS
jgi:ADP-heptose:LPS heptosyltransferase